MTHSSAEIADLSRRALQFRLGTRRLFEEGQTKGDMWFFELWHFLGDVQDALAATPVEAATPSRAQFEQWAKAWHDTCETIMTLLDLPGGGSPQEMLAQVQARGVAQPSLDWKAEAGRRFGPIPAGDGENTRLIAGYHYAFIEGAKAALAMTSTDRAEPGWSAAQFWEYVEGLTDAHVMGQIRDMLSSQGLSVSRPHRETK